MGFSLFSLRRHDDAMALPTVGRLRKIGARLRRAVLTRTGAVVFMVGCAVLALSGASRDSHVQHLSTGWYMDLNRYAGSMFEATLLEKNPPIGPFRTDYKKVEKMMQPYHDLPLLSLPIHTIKKDVEALPWSDSVAVRRRFPSSLEIIVKEHVPAAIWQQDGRFYVINTGGEIIEETEDYRDYKELMLVSGMGAAEKIQSLMDMLTAHPKVLVRVASASFVGQRRWDMYLKSGLLVSLPEDEPQKRVAKLDSMIRKGYLESRPMKTIDMRLEKRIYIEPKHGPGSYFDQDEDGDA